MNKRRAGSPSAQAARQKIRSRRQNRGAKLKAPCWNAIIRERMDCTAPAALAARARAGCSSTSRIFPASDRNGKGYSKKSWAKSPTPFRRTVSSAYPETNKTLRSGRSEARFCQFGTTHLRHDPVRDHQINHARPGFHLIESFCRSQPTARCSRSWTGTRLPTVALLLHLLPAGSPPPVYRLFGRRSAGNLRRSRRGNGEIDFEGSALTSLAVG